MQKFEYDFVVVGSGLAGLTAAFYASRFGSVAIVTKSELDTSNSWFAQGGIAAVTGEDDDPELHINDTLVAGRGLCDYDAVEVLVKEGSERVRELIEMGMPFDREGGKIVLGLEGGHSRRRILHAGGDATGKELTRFMLRKVQDTKNIVSFEYTTVVNLFSEGNCFAGLQAIDFRRNENVFFKSKAVIMATGGLSRLYSRSTNPHTATGDGIALAYDCGAQLSDIEFIQFHPSALSAPGRDAFLISEAVRGEGAWLLNKNGERFMTGIHPLAELAPRDVVAHAIYNEMMKSHSDSVYLSLKHLDPEYISHRFLTINQTLLDYGYDMTKDLLPVAPAAHYMVGGIRSGLYGETNVHGLFVCGEAASTGVMGANRLASNSLLECLVFGKRASERAAEMPESQCLIPDPEPIRLNPDTDKVFLDFRNEMATSMMINMGIIRAKSRMETAVSRFKEIRDLFMDHQQDYNRLKIRNMATLCYLISRAALVRTESRGGHIREDFPDENPSLRAHIIQQIEKKPIFVPVIDKK